PDEINLPRGSDRNAMELDERSIKLKKFRQRMKKAAKHAADEDKQLDPGFQVFKMFSNSFRIALLKDDFEKTEIQMVIDELNDLIGAGTLFEVSGKPDESAGNRATNASSTEAGYVDSKELTPWAKSRLRLQMVFPVLIAKVWDSLPVVYAWIHSQEE